MKCPLCECARRPVICHCGARTREARRRSRVLVHSAPGCHCGARALGATTKPCSSPRALSIVIARSPRSQTEEDEAISSVPPASPAVAARGRRHAPRSFRAPRPFVTPVHHHAVESQSFRAFAVSDFSACFEYRISDFEFAVCVLPLVSRFEFRVCRFLARRVPRPSRSRPHHPPASPIENPNSVA
jgi:hypothetical protein